jgi:plasmid stability protein
MVIAFDAITPEVYHAGAMATIIVRNLDDLVAERLRLRARLNGVSVEEEARRVLAEGTKITRKEIAEEAAAIRSRQKPDSQRAEDIIRRYRDRPLRGSARARKDDTP